MSDSPLAAYWRFFEAFNTRDAHSFSSAMNYPHVRVSWSRRSSVLADAEAHALSVSWDAFIRDGWDHTNGHEPTVIAAGAKKAHIAGGWTRMNAREEEILRNRVCYIVTNVEGHWGIQSRFGTDPGAGTEMVETTRAIEFASAFLAAMETGDSAVAWQYLPDEFLVIGVGKVTRHKRGDTLAVPQLPSAVVDVIQHGPRSITVNATAGNHQALLYTVLDTKHQLQIKAGSWL